VFVYLEILITRLVCKSSNLRDVSTIRVTQTNKPISSHLIAYATCFTFHNYSLTTTMHWPQIPPMLRVLPCHTRRTQLRDHHSEKRNVLVRRISFRALYVTSSCPVNAKVNMPCNMTQLCSWSTEIV